MKRHRFAVPCLVYISNEKKHCERFAIRSRSMTLNPRRNKYVKNFANIRIIQVVCLCRWVRARVVCLRGESEEGEGEGQREGEEGEGEGQGEGEEDEGEGERVRG